MQKTTLAVAKMLEAEIELASDHLKKEFKDFRHFRERREDWKGRPFLQTKNGGNANNFELLQCFMPMAESEFMALYQMKAEKWIADREYDLGLLNDSNAKIINDKYGFTVFGAMAG